MLYLLTAVVSLGNTAADASSSLTIKKKFNLSITYYTPYPKFNVKTSVFFGQTRHTTEVNGAFETKQIDSSMVIRKVNQHKLHSIP